MPKYLFVFHGGTMPEDPADIEKAMAEWGAWFAEMGDAVVYPGGPAGKSHTVSKDGVAENGGANPIAGLTIVEAPDHAAACEMAKGCPEVKNGTGTVEVAEEIQM